MNPTLPAEVPAPRKRSPRRALLEFLFAFSCVFAGLALPSPGLGPLYVRAHTALGNAVVTRLALTSGVGLAFAAPREELIAEPWRTTLQITPIRPAAPAQVPIDLRGLLFLPTAAFVGLSLAAPLGSVRRNLLVLALGLPLLELLLLALMSVPLVSFLGGTGPVQAFELGVASHAALQVVYRALVAPPGMAFALPLLLWWLLVSRVGGLGTSEIRTSLSNFDGRGEPDEANERFKD